MLSECGRTSPRLRQLLTETVVGSTSLPPRVAWWEMLVALTQPVNSSTSSAPSGEAESTDRRNRSHPDELELLDTPVDRLERSDFSGVQVALRINRQVVKSTELARRRAPLSESI